MWLKNNETLLEADVFPSPRHGEININIRSNWSAATRIRSQGIFLCINLAIDSPILSRRTPWDIDISLLLPSCLGGELRRSQVSTWPLRHPLLNNPAASEPTFQRTEAELSVPEANDDVDTVHFFRDPVQGGFPSKKDIHVLLGFRNTGEASLNVTHIAGSLRVPGQGSFYVANFTERAYNAVVEPGKEASILYSFSLDSQLAGHDCNVELAVFYQDSEELFSTTFFNSTVQVLDPVGVIDTKLIFMYLTVLSVLFFATYTSLHASGTSFPAATTLFKKTLPAILKKNKEAGFYSHHRVDEWLKGTAWTPHAVKRKWTKEQQLRTRFWPSMPYEVFDACLYLFSAARNIL